MIKKLRFIMLFVAVLAVASCSSDENKGKGPEGGFGPRGGKGMEHNQLSVEEMYTKAQRSLKNEDYAEASKQFDEVEQNYPYSDWAKRAQLMSAFAYYKNLKYDDAVTALDRFIQLHPGDESVDYAYYLKSLCYYERISDVGRDQKMTEQALDSLKQIVSRFPESKYARDAKMKMDLAIDHIAGKNMEVGRYYLERKQYQAAINRFEKVVEQYQTTTHVPEALHRLVESYMSLGIMDEAKKDAAILGTNYPQSQWYKDTYKLFVAMPEKDQDKSFIKKTFGKLF